MSMDLVLVISTDHTDDRLHGISSEVVVKESSNWECSGQLADQSERAIQLNDVPETECTHTDNVKNNGEFHNNVNAERSEEAQVTENSRKRKVLLYEGLSGMDGGGVQIASAAAVVEAGKDSVPASLPPSEMGQQTEVYAAGKTVQNKRKLRSKKCSEDAMCVHNIAKSSCDACKERTGNCIHNRRKAYCKECGGSSICTHNRRTSQCRECGGSGVCVHNRLKRFCKECGGSAFCEHNRIRTNCVECGGGSLCEHKRQRTQCRVCGGSSICKHNRQKTRCRECGGGSMCVHNRRKSTCKECKGSAICVHNRQKWACKDCGGSALCEHNRQKCLCRDCGGSFICEHERQKTQCKVCKGGSDGSCEHGILIANCHDCCGRESGQADKSTSTLHCDEKENDNENDKSGTT